MILSMTGFGKADASYGEKKIHVVVKSLNSKSMDISTRISPIYREYELEIRAMISEKLTRGKVDFSLTTENTSSASSTSINADVVKSYIQQIKDVSQQNGISQPQDWWIVLSRMNDITSTTEQENVDEEEWVAVKKAIIEALDQLVLFRTQEGEALAKKFKEKIDNIARLLIEVEPFETCRVKKIKERILSELAQIKGVAIDQGRLEQEMIYYIEKLDVSEEKQRLANHLKYFNETMDGACGQGKKLGFIVPIRIWMADDRYNADVRRLFASDIAEKFFHVEEIRAIFDEYVGGNSDNWRKVWTIYTFLVWYEEYFVKR